MNEGAAWRRPGRVRVIEPEFGARPLRRTIQTELDNSLSNMLLDGTLNPGDTVVAHVRDGELVLTWADQESVDSA